MYVFSNVRGDPLLPRFPLPSWSSGSVARVRVLARALFAGSASICWKRKTTHYLPRGRVLWFGRLIFFPSATSLCTRNWISLALSMPRKFIAVERWEALSMVRCSPGESMVVSFIFRLLYFFHKLGKKGLFLFWLRSSISNTSKVYFIMYRLRPKIKYSNEPLSQEENSIFEANDNLSQCNFFLIFHAME